MMLPRHVSSSARTMCDAVRTSMGSSASGTMQHAMFASGSRAMQPSSSSLLRHAPPAQRSIHSSSTRLAKKIPLREREVMAELRYLRQMVEQDDKTQFSKESSANLPALTDDTLELLYEAINMPDPPTDEEMRLEDRRRRLLGSVEEGDTLERKRRRALRRMADVSKRLDEIRRLSRPVDTRKQDDQTKRIVELLQGVQEKNEWEEKNIKEIDRAERGTSDNIDANTLPRTDISTPSILAQIEGVVSNLSQRMPTESAISLGLLTKQDWRALARWCAASNQMQSLPQLFSLMKECGQASLRLDVANIALDLLAEEGAVAQCQSLAAVMQEANLEQDAYTRHCLVKSYIHSERLDEAIMMLRSFANAIPASLSTYTLTIEALLAQKLRPDVQTKAWSLFTEMRFTAHPVPDAPLYAQMIKACALGVTQPEQHVWKPSSKGPCLGQVQARRSDVRPPGHREVDSERALDLFREMTFRYNIRPTSDVFTAVILACTRRQDMYRKGIEVFQSMLDLERERLKANDSSMPSFAPERRAYNSLLQGCARNGDLVRARWVLAEMLRSSMALSASLQQRRGQEVQEWEWREVMMRRPDEETLALVFLTYAAYNPIAAQGELGIKKVDAINNTATKERRVSEEQQHTDVRIHESTNDNQAGTFSGSQLPGSSAAVLGEVEGLLHRVASDEGDPGLLLSTVKPNGRMLYAYLSVLSVHGGRERVRRMERVLFGSDEANDDDPLELNGASLYERWGVPIDGPACEAVLRACVKIGDRVQADAVSARVWQAWQQLSDRASSGSGSDIAYGEQFRSLDPVSVGRCWSQMICNEAKSHRLPEAMQLLRSFVDQYPPPTARQHISSDSTGAGGALRPSLTFKQLQLLHRRLTTRMQATSVVYQLDDDDVKLDEMIKENRRIGEDLAFFTWAMHAYEATLRPRMPDILKDAGRYIEHYQRP